MRGWPHPTHSLTMRIQDTPSSRRQAIPTTTGQRLAQSLLDSYDIRTSAIVQFGVGHAPTRFGLRPYPTIERSLRLTPINSRRYANCRSTDPANVRSNVYRLLRCIGGLLRATSTRSTRVSGAVRLVHSPRPGDSSHRRSCAGPRMRSRRPISITCRQWVRGDRRRRE
jgi:hypothetical protein